MNDKIRILMLEDSLADAELAERELRRAGMIFASKRVDTKDAFIRELEDFRPDIVLADYKLPAFDGRSAVELARQTHPEVPVIMVTGTLGDEAAVELLKAGAKDYVLKDGLTRLAPAVRRALSEEQGIRARKQAERAVKDSETRFRSLIEYASDLVAVVDARGRIAYISPAIKRLGGYEVDEVLGTSYVDYTHPEDRPAANTGLSELLRNPGKLHVSEFRFRHKDGAWVTLESIARNALDDPAINGIVINSRDITERKHAEEKVAKLNRLYATLSGINTAIVHSTSAAELFDRVCEVAVAQGRFGVAWIGTLDRADQTVTPVAHRGLLPEEMAMIRDSIGRIADGRGRTATAIRENRTIYTGDYEVEDTASPWHAQAAKRGIRGSATLPIKRAGEIVGVLKLYAREQDFFDAEQLALLEEMRTDISFALDRFDAEAKKTQAEAALVESEGRLKAIFDAAADGIVLADAGTRKFEAANASFCRMLGYDLDELLGLGAADIHPVEALPHVMRQFDLQATGQIDIATDLPVMRKDGGVFYADVNSTPVTLGGKACLLGVFRDVTERKLAEAARAELAALVASSHDAIYGADLNGIVTVWNPGAAQMFGYGAGEIIGRPITVLVPAERTDEPLQLRQRALGGEVVSDFETVRLRKDGKRIEVAFTVSPVRDGSGNAVGLSVVARDITQRKRAEEELNRLNWALRALGQSNSALVHAGTEKELFQACCDAIAGGEGYPLAWVGLARDDPARSVEIIAAAGEELEYAQGLDVSWADTPHGRGPAGVVLRTGTTQVTNNLAGSDAYSPWIARASARGIASSIALPIRTNGGAIGALTIYSREVDAFQQPEVNLFEELAADIGYGIASRRTRSERDHLQQEQLLGVERLKAALIGTIGAVALTVEKRDPYTAGHQQRVAELCVAIGRKLDFSEDRVEGLRLGATIHDIGKIYVPAEILNRPGKLSKPEFEIIKSHPQVGYDIVKDVRFPWPVTDMILQHHERLDGSGYPNKLKGDEIILEARILAVADVIEAMSSHRPYRPGLGLDAALAQIAKESGTTLDAQVVDACERLFREQGFAFSKA